MVNEIRNGIAARNCLEIHYGPGWRLVEPHVLGRASNGDVVLRAFQVSGASASGAAAGWKLLRLDRMTALRPGDGHFAGPRPDYNPVDPAMKGGIIAGL
ncbi:MAG: hypothetical protein ACFCUR_09935 [Rhodomicrobiaceae bacterium]